MEKQTQQHIELLQRENKRLKQQVEGYQQQALPQQHGSPVPWQVSENQSWRIQELEHEVERLRQDRERLSDEARAQQEQDRAAIAALQQDNERLRQDAEQQGAVVNPGMMKDVSVAC